MFFFVFNLVAAEGVILGFQHYLVVLGTIVIVSTILVPLIGGGNVMQIFNTLQSCLSI